MSSNPAVPNSSLGAIGEHGKESAGIARASDAARPDGAKAAVSASATMTSAQVDVRSARINDPLDAAWINEPPALDTAMLDQIKSAIREGRFVIDERAIALALSEDAIR